MSPEQRLEEFKCFLECRIELFAEFMSYPEKNWFDDEFTFENWLRGTNGITTYGGRMDIRTRNLNTPLVTINKEGFNNFGHKISVPIEEGKKVTETFEYSTYRFKKYNFKQRLFIDKKEVL